MSKNLLLRNAQIILAFWHNAIREIEDEARVAKSG